MKLQPEVAADFGLHSTKTGREEGAHLYSMFKKKEEEKENIFLKILSYPAVIFHLKTKNSLFYGSFSLQIRVDLAH